MAWVNATIDGLETCTIPIEKYATYTSSSEYLGTSVPSGYTYIVGATMRQGGTNFHHEDFWILGNSTWGLLGRKVTQYDWQWHFDLYANGVNIDGFNFQFGSGNSTANVGFAFGINEETQKGTYALLYKKDGQYYANYIQSLTNADNVYNWIKNFTPVLYNWQSVPSISGKNGILTLSTLNDVNDGEPVETSDTSKFNLTDDSNVSALVAAHFSQ